MTILSLKEHRSCADGRAPALATFTVEQRARAARCATVKVQHESAGTVHSREITVPSISNVGTWWATRVVFCTVHQTSLISGVNYTLPTLPASRTLPTPC